jgi:light-regulated signal transduction histidine kinase (bacteriophytochrome)
LNKPEKYARLKITPAMMDYEADLARTLMENMQEGALALSPEGSVLFCNPAFAAMARLPAEDAVSRPFPSFFEDGARRMQAMIRSLLDYSRLRSGPGPLARVDLGEVLDRAVFNLGAAISESGARIERGPLVQVEADEAQMLHLLQNLVGNAVKFRKKGESPKVRVSAEDQGGSSVVCVADEGVGFDPRFSKRLFQMFNRLHPRAEFPGHGIGLAFCKKIVEGHGGRIWAESEPGQGSRFFFSLPKRGRR